MARIPREYRLETREARTRLPNKEEPYWRSISPGLFVGYREGARGGKWWRRRLAEGRAGYEKKCVVKAADFQDVNGRDVLSYAQAVHAVMDRADPDKRSEEQKQERCPVR